MHHLHGGNAHTMPRSSALLSPQVPNKIPSPALRRVQPEPDPATLGNSEVGTHHPISNKEQQQPDKKLLGVWCEVFNVQAFIPSPLCYEMERLLRASWHCWSPWKEECWQEVFLPAAPARSSALASPLQPAPCLLPRTTFPPLLRDLMPQEAGPGHAAVPTASLLGHISPSSHPNPRIFCACSETASSPLNPGRFAWGRAAGLMPSTQAAKPSSRWAEMKSWGSSGTLNHSKCLQSKRPSRRGCSSSAHGAGSLPVPACCCCTEGAASGSFEVHKSDC